MVKKLYLLNDETTSFHKVYASLIRFAKHNPLQAEQCTLIAHYNGKVSIKEGDIMEVLSLKAILENQGLTLEMN